MPKVRLFVLVALLAALVAAIAAYRFSRVHVRRPIEGAIHQSPTGDRKPQNEWMFLFDVHALAPATPAAPRPTADAPARDFALIWFCQEGTDGYCMALGRDQAELRKKAGPRITVLGKTSFPALGPPQGAAARDTIELAIQRKASGLCVALANRPIFRSPDAEFSSRQVSIQSHGSPFQVTLRRIQPLGEIYFTDDFMRTQSSGVWRPTSGNWHICALQIAERSANAFSLFAQFARSPRYNPLFTGRTRRYVGIGIRTERKAGREKIIYVFENTPAWRAGLHFGDVIKSVDGTPVDNMTEDDLRRRVQGVVGTTVRLTVSRMVDGIEKEVECIAERQPIDVDQIEDMVPLSPAPASDTTFIFAGYHFWSDYTFAVSAKSLGEGEFGLVFYRRDDDNYYLFKWSASAGFSLAKVANGKPSRLAERAGEFVPGQYYRLSVSVRGTAITARVDGVVVLEAKDEELLWGEIGLYAAHSMGAYFDDVTVTSSDLPAASVAKGLGPLFIRDERMKEWASTEMDWTEPEPVRGLPVQWNKFSFPGESRVEIRRFFGDRLLLVLNAARRADADGYMLDLNRATRLGILYRNGVALKETTALPAYFSSVAFGATQERLVASVDRKEVLSFMDPAPLTGGNVSLGGDIADVDFSSVSLASSNVLDDTFTTAPVNWRIAGGTWGMMNRWVCDPRWSWFGGRSKALAAICSKSAFVGDVTVDAFAAMEMPSYWKSPHEKASDLGVTICGDGQNLATGYTLLLGGELNRWTRLYRGERMVAETRSPLFRFSEREHGEEEGLALHRNWVHVTLQKRGSHVLFYLGGILGLEFNDPDPLPGGHVALWTVNNGVLIARARIAYAEGKPPVVALRDFGEFADSKVTNVRDGEFSAAVAPADGACRVTNALSGGRFAIYPRPDRINLAETPLVSFDYKIPPGVKVDLYFDYEGNRHRVLLTGPRDDVVAVTAGRFPHVQADGTWRHAEFRLLDAMKDLYPYKSNFVIENVTLGNYSNDGYLLAGFGGNHKGDSYLLKNFAFAAPPKQPSSQVSVAAVEFPFQSPQNSSRAIWRLRPESGQVIDFDKLTVEVKGPSPEARHDFAAGHPALSFRRLENIVELDLPRAGFSLKDGDVLKVALHGLSAARVAHESEWRFRLAEDHAPPQDIRITFGQPDFLHTSFEQDLGDCYPVGAQTWTMPGPAGGWLRREPLRGGLPLPGMGPHCLRVQNKRMAHDYGVGFLKQACDVGRFPILSFGYRLPPRISLDLSFILLDREGASAGSGQRMSLQWATQTYRQDLRAYGTFPTIGILSKPVQDGAWHHADINLFKKLKNFDPARTAYLISDIHIADDVSGYLGNYEGVSFWLDNIRMRPVMNAEGLRPTWTASDISGISDYKSAFNPDPNLSPTGKVSPEDMAALRDGATYFHLMLRDGAGNWSRPMHELVFLDVTPPEVAYFAPVWEMPGTFDIRFLELGGLDPRSILVRVAGREYRVDGKQMWYNQETQRLTWRAEKGSGFRGQGSEVREVEVTLATAQDFAGNKAMGLPQSWQWRILPAAIPVPAEPLPQLPFPPLPK